MKNEIISNKYLIPVCMYLGYMQMILETTYSSQTKLIGEGFLIGQHGIGYSNLAFEAKKGQKRPKKAKKGQYSVLSP